MQYYACCRKPIQCSGVGVRNTCVVDWLPSAHDKWIYEPTQYRLPVDKHVFISTVTTSKSYFPKAPFVHATETRKILPSTIAVPLSLRDKVMQVCSATALSFANGAFMGGIFGLVQGGVSSKSFGGAWKEAAISGRTWGAISAIYACLQSASKVVRGKDDKYNNVVGACGSGAFFSWNNGFRAALQGCISFALFSYLIDMFLTPKTPLERRRWNEFSDSIPKK
ncbi:hypothetical protein GpartN1_g4360.t1 [Galdieria partita]|uniref:Mitochondrial import inner membrane translocase subunit TIM22 n=1 Tax=Galdieria partita TaxID=83374 RepID=A0A9C7PXU8_9RHOD|nr:hypothetical protein GpartN1_g4360.t1 [Galdieria partita]